MLIQIQDKFSRRNFTIRDVIPGDVLTGRTLLFDTKSKPDIPFDKSYRIIGSDTIQFPRLAVGRYGNTNLGFIEYRVSNGGSPYVFYREDLGWNTENFVIPEFTVRRILSFLRNDVAAIVLNDYTDNYKLIGVMPWLDLRPVSINLSSCGDTKMNVLSVSGLPTGESVLIESRIGTSDLWETCSFADDSPMLISTDTNVQMPIANVTIRASYSGLTVPGSLKVELS
jgi:hypothetical protein